MNCAYVRVSTKQQNEARQIETLKKYNIDKWYIEKESGVTMDRPKMLEMLRSLKSGDTVYISDFSRLARNTYDLLCIAEDLEHNGVNLVRYRNGEITKTEFSVAIGVSRPTLNKLLNLYREE